MSGHCTVDEFSSLRNDRAWYNLTFVMVELIWHDVEGKRLVIIFLDQNVRTLFLFAIYVIRVNVFSPLNVFFF